MALEQIADWMDVNAEEVVFEPNLDFADTAMDANTMNALLQSWMNKGISYETYFEQLQKAAIIPDSREMDEEIEAIETTGPMLLTGSLPPPMSSAPSNVERNPTASNNNTADTASAEDELTEGNT